MQQNIPDLIDGAELISSLILKPKHLPTGNTKHWVGGELVTKIYGLAICKYANSDGIYLFYCNENWETITDTYHKSVEDAKDQAAYEFENSIEDWWEKI